MEYTSLGKTGLQVSVAGLGCGGHSQLGLARGKTEDEAVDLVRCALDLGVNFFDTSEAYVTEPILGRAIKGYDRDKVVLCSKSRYRNMQTGELHPVQKVLDNMDQSLKQLDVDYVDVFMIHGALPEHHEHIRDNLAPALLREKEKGKFRHIGLSEFPGRDPEQEMLPKALNDGIWEVMMTGFHMMHQVARQKVFPRAIEQGVGTAVMFAVRNIFSNPDTLRETVRELAAEGKIPAELDKDNPLDFLIHEGGAESMIDAAYRFVRHEPGVNVTLFGTSDQKHMHSNVGSILRPPLPKADVEKLYSLFGHLRGVGLDIPKVTR